MNNLERFQKFMQYNLDIKKIMADCSPEDTYYNSIDNDVAIKYSDKLYKAMKSIEKSFIQIIDIMPGYRDLYKEYFKPIFHNAYKAIDYNAGDYESLKNIYRDYMSNIRPEIIEEVGNNCKGYYIWGFLNFKHAKSVNELLHMMHQSIINNEKFYKSMPEIDSKEGAEGPVNLYGNPSILAKQIFNGFDLEIKSGITDILSISEDSIIMMVRDYGHALTVEIEREKDEYYIRYFIPKICNVEMVNALPGVRKVDGSSKFTTGVFQSNSETVVIDLIEFIKRVPQDIHMRNDFEKKAI